MSPVQFRPQPPFSSEDHDAPALHVADVGISRDSAVDSAKAAAAVITLGAWLPYSPLASELGFTALPLIYWPILLATLLCYVALTQILKRWLVRKAWL